MRRDIDTALDRCLIWLRDGMDVESCLARCPEYADELRPLLELVTQVGRVIPPAPSVEVRAAGEQRMLATLAQKRERQTKSSPGIGYMRRIVRSLIPGRPGSLKPVWHFVAVMLSVLLITISGLAVAASADSLPGDSLYPVKLANQEVRLFLTINLAKHQTLEARFDAERRSDVESALKAGRQATVEFRGLLHQVEGNLWMIGGMPVLVQDTTEIVGQPSFNVLVRVRGQLPGNGSLVATQLRVEPASVHRPEFTPTLRPTATPEPTATPQPTSTPAVTRAPTEMPSLIRTLAPTEQPEPTGPPKPGDVPQATEAPKPAEPGKPTTEPTPTGTPEPEETDEEDDERRKATHTPEPEETDEEDDEGREATHTPEPEETDEEDDEAEATDTPEPTKTPESDHGSRPAQRAEPTRKPEINGLVQPLSFVVEDQRITEPWQI